MDIHRLLLILEEDTINRQARINGDSMEQPSCGTITAGRGQSTMSTLTTAASACPDDAVE